jgi:hypothetical protein
MKLIGDLAKICTENHIDQLKLADGTCIVMNQLAFYKDVLPETNQKPNQSGDFKLDTPLSLDETIDEELLFSSAR